MLLEKKHLNNRIFQKFVRILKEHDRFYLSTKNHAKKMKTFFELERFKENWHFLKDKIKYREWDSIQLPLESKPRPLPLSHFSHSNEILELAYSHVFLHMKSINHFFMIFCR